MDDPYFKRMQDYAEKNRRKVIEEAIDGPPPATAAPTGMTQATFGGKKTPPNAAQRAKLAELLKKQAQE